MDIQSKFEKTVINVLKRDGVGEIHPLSNLYCDICDEVFPTNNFNKLNWKKKRVRIKYRLDKMIKKDIIKKDIMGTGYGATGFVGNTKWLTSYYLVGSLYDNK